MRWLNKIAISLIRGNNLSTILTIGHIGLSITTGTMSVCNHCNVIFKQRQSTNYQTFSMSQTVKYWIVSTQWIVGAKKWYFWEYF